MKRIVNFAKGIISFASTMSWCLSFSWGSSKLYTITRIVANIVTPLLTILVAFVTKYLIDLLARAWEVENAHKTLLLLFSGLLLIALFRMISQKVVQYSESMQDDILNSRIAMTLMQRTLSADLEYFDNPEYYDIIQSAKRDSMSASYILWNALSCVSAIVSFLGTFAVLFQANPLYGLVMMAAAVPSSIAAAKYTKLLYVLSLEQINEHRQMYYCQDIASEKTFAQDIRLFNAGEKLLTRYQRIWETLFQKRKCVSRRRSISTGILECLPEMVVVFIGIDIAFGAFNGTNTVGDYALFTGLAAQLWSSINSFSTSSLMIYDNKLKIENIKKLDTFQNRVEDIGTERIFQIESITFKNVTFTYPGTSTMVLSEISFSITKDEKVVLVGLNGSGKSTIIKLLLRMYDPDTGIIEVNGLDIKAYKLSELRSNFSVYFQEMQNYHFTMRENFTIADSKQDIEQIDRLATDALSAAYGNDILYKSNKGLDTSITRVFDPEGIELSGGQHQKLALARTLFRRHTALILDEPSSNLDPKAEYEIFKALASLTDGKMTIFTSHRLSNVALADRILVLENGRLVEDGTQNELIKNKHRYAELYRYQQEKYSQGNDD